MYLVFQKFNGSKIVFKSIKISEYLNIYFEIFSKKILNTEVVTLIKFIFFVLQQKKKKLRNKCLESWSTIIGQKIHTPLWVPESLCVCVYVWIIYKVDSMEYRVEPSIFPTCRKKPFILWSKANQRNHTILVSVIT